MPSNSAYFHFLFQHAICNNYCTLFERSGPYEYEYLRVVRVYDGALAFSASIDPLAFIVPLVIVIVEAVMIVIAIIAVCIAMHY